MTPSLDEVRPTLARLVDDLEANGIDSRHLRALQAELSDLEEPPTFLARVARGVRRLAARNWEHVKGEVHESRRLIELVSKALVSGKDTLTEDERAEARGQLADLLRMAPASAIFVAMEAFPIPGTAVFTPWVLFRLGLMPSRWREAHLLAGLRQEVARLVAGAHPAEALRLEGVLEEVEATCNARERRAHEMALLRHWDLDGNGVLDADERVLYDAAVARLAHRAQFAASESEWFLQCEGHVFGPYRLSVLAAIQTEVPLLVCSDADRSWVDFNDLRDRWRPAGAPPESPAPATDGQ